MRYIVLYFAIIMQYQIVDLYDRATQFFLNYPVIISNANITEKYLILIP